MHDDGLDDGSKPLVADAHAHPTFHDDGADHGAGSAKAVRANPSGGGMLSFLGHKKGLDEILREAAKENEGDGAGE